MNFYISPSQASLTLQMPSFQSKLDTENYYNFIWDIIKLFDEEESLKLIKNYDITDLKNFKINIVNELILSNRYEIANYFISKKFYFDSYLLLTPSLGEWLSLSKEKEKNWILQAEPLSHALKYVIYKNDTDLFDLLIQSATFSTSISDAVNLTIQLNRLEFLKSLLKINKTILQADDLHAVKSEECAIILLPFLPSHSKCIDYFVKQKNFIALKSYLENPKHIDLHISSFALKKCNDLSQLQFLISRCKKIEGHVIDLFIKQKNFEILSVIIKNFILIEINDKTIPLYAYDILWKTHETFLLLVPYIGNQIPTNEALIFCVSFNHVEYVAKILETISYIRSDILYFAKTDDVCLLFSHYEFSFDVDIIEHLIKIKANNYLKHLYNQKKYSFNKKNLNDAVIYQNDDVVCLLLSHVQSDTITLALTSTEAILDCILIHTHKINPDILNTYEITSPIQLTYTRLSFFLLYFQNIKPEILSDALIHLSDNEFLKCCKLLKQKHYQYLPLFVNLSLQKTEKPQTLSWFLSHFKETICIKKINESSEIKDLIINHLNTNKIYLDPDCFGNLYSMDNIPIDLFIHIILIKAPNAIWKESFCNYASFFREFVKIMRSSHYIEWDFDPVSSLIKFLNKANNAEIVSFTITFLNRILSLENKFIWKLIKEHIVKNQFIFSDHLSIFSSHFFHISIFDIYPYLKKICEKYKEDDEFLSVYAFKLAFLFESLEETSKYIDHYLKKYSTVASPVKHASNFSLPFTHLKNKSFWISLIIKRNYHLKLLNILYLVPAIEKSILGPLPSRNEFLVETSDTSDEKNITNYYLRKIKEIAPLEWTKGKLKKTQKKTIQWDYCQKYLSTDVEEFIKHKISIIKRQVGQKSFQEEKEKLLIKIETEKPFKELLAFIIKRRDLSTYGIEELVSLSIKNIYLKIPNHLVSFAVSCAIGAISYQGFEKILSLLEHPKKQDFLPEIVVKNELYPNYVLKKIGFDNPFSLVLGIPTLSCQNIGSSGENVTIHGYKSAFGGFYYIENKNSESNNQIIAAAWAGITENGELVFDSVEFNPFYSSKMIADFFKAAAKAIIVQEPSICTVLVGNDGSTPEELKTEINHKYISKIIGYEKLGYDSAFRRFILSKNQSISKNFRIVLTTGIDCYISKGKKVRDLALNPLDRIQFWKDHPKVFKCLRTNLKNPLLEEGYFSHHTRDHQGEFFLTDVALNKLQQYLAPGTLFINFNLANTPVLPALKKKESISLLILNSFHASCCYIENVDDQIKIFIVDSEPDFYHHSPLLTLLDKCYPQAKIIFSSARLQFDYNTCGVFTLKILRYFYKEKSRIFDQIDNDELLLTTKGHFLLKKEKTPAQLLKMAQCPIIHESTSSYAITLSETVLNSIVSEKKYLTLKQYLERYQFKAERIYSTAAIRIKYRFFELLEKLL